MSWARGRRSVLAALACAGCAACSLAVAATPGRGNAHRPAHRCRSQRRGAHPRRCRPSPRGHAPERKPRQGAAPIAPSAATQPALAPAQPGSQQPPASTGPVTEPTPAPSRAQVTAVEYKLTLSRTQVSAGRTTIELIDGGQDEHNLHIRPAAGGPDVAAFPTIRSGQHVDERIELAPGTYTFYCSLPGHEALGMRATFTVGAQPGATASASRTRSGSP
jgi:plastocyanin